jgi:hypothetical protein
VRSSGGFAGDTLMLPDHIIGGPAGPRLNGPILEAEVYADLEAVAQVDGS